MITCRDCGWGHDDFFDKNYNPITALSHWNDYLFGDKHYELDKPFTDDSEFIKTNGNITTREVISNQYNRFARAILKRKWITFDDWKNDGDKKCPICGSKKLSMD